MYVEHMRLKNSDKNEFLLYLMSNVSNSTMIIHYTNAFSYVVVYISVVTFIIIIVVILHNMYIAYRYRLKPLNIVVIHGQP